MHHSNMPRKQARLGSVQGEYVNRLRAELLSQGGDTNTDLSFTQGVNLAVVIAMAHHHAPAYKDHIMQAEGIDLTTHEVAAELVGQYIQHRYVPSTMKDVYGQEAESFILSVMQTILTQEPGFPKEGWWDEHTVDHDTFNEQFTAEPPSES